MSAFVARCVTRSQTIQLPAAPEVVFPLFSPLGEQHWDPAWSPTMLYPASGEAQTGTVFTTQHATEAVRVWTIVAYDRVRLRLSYVNVAPASHLTRIDIRCDAARPQATSARVTYTLTALTPQGNTHLDGFTAAQYQATIASWEAAITHYLAHGRPPTHG